MVSIQHNARNERKDRFHLCVVIDAPAAFVPFFFAYCFAFIALAAYIFAFVAYAGCVTLDGNHA